MTSTFSKRALQRLYGEQAFELCLPAITHEEVGNDKIQVDTSHEAYWSMCNTKNKQPTADEIAKMAAQGIAYTPPGKCGGCGQ